MTFSFLIQTLIWLFCITHTSQALDAYINYSHLKSRSSYFREREEKRLQQILETDGFFVLTNHGMDHEIMDRAWNDSVLFFDSSEENKFSVPMTDEYIYGYSNEEVLSQTEEDTEKESVMDNKETFQVWIGAENTNRSKDVLWSAYPQRMESSWTAYYRECEKIMFGLLESIANILELDPHFFAQYANDHLSALRALNYPAIKDSISHEGGLRCSQHSDWGLLTMIRQDIVGGLQVENHHGEWIDVISDFYDFAVNTGDLLQRWTNDRFKSNRHRVVDYYAFNGQKITERRQSIAFFYISNGDTMVDPVDARLANETTTKYDAVNVWQYLSSKHSRAVEVKPHYV
eukprot:202337_1